MLKLTSRLSYQPDLIVVSKQAAKDSLTEKILITFPECRVLETDSQEDPLCFKEDDQAIHTPDLRNHFKIKNSSQAFSMGKTVLFLTHFKGEWLKPCPGTNKHVCCNLWVVNASEGCPMDCSYCYLQSYLLRRPTLKIYTNTNAMLKTLTDRFVSEDKRLFRVCTGELTDSLVWDNLTEQSLELVPFFARFDNAILELKTKSANIENLIKMRDLHNNHTVVSWSVNAPSIVEKEEHLTSSLEERLRAANVATKSGYRVGFHFDPLIYFEGWEKEYREVVERIFEAVKPEDVAWVSISALRYREQMQQVMLERFKQSKIPFGEQFLASDQKLRYIQPLRFKMTSFVWNLIKERGQNIPTYMCMESPAAWRVINSGPPVAGSELVEVFSRNGRLRMINK